MPRSVTLDRAELRDRVRRANDELRAARAIAETSVRLPRGVLADLVDAELTSVEILVRLRG